MSKVDNSDSFEMQLGSKCFRDAAAVIRTLKKSNELSPPLATRRFNMNVWKHLAGQRPASRLYMVYIWYDFNIFSFLSDCLMLRYLCVFQRHTERAHHIYFLHHFSLQEARWLVPKGACCALGCVKVVGHPLHWEHWLNLSPLGLQVRVWVNLARHW